METSKVREFYNTTMPQKYGQDYEFSRWFKTPALRAAHKMTKLSIEQCVFRGGKIYENVFELGPGAGTWSKLLLESKLIKHLDMLDISSQMLSLSKERLKQYKNVRFIEQDFLEFHPEKQYGFFFSSRVLEYLPDKEKSVLKISEILLPGGRGFIITKTPKTIINKILRRKVSELHRGQVSPKNLSRLLQDGGFSEIKIYPVTLSFPLFKSAALNTLLYKVFGGLSLNPVSHFFSESYSVQFIKK